MRPAPRAHDDRLNPSLCGARYGHLGFAFGFAFPLEAFSVLAVPTHAFSCSARMKAHSL
jgi:hypothetical protein